MTPLGDGVSPIDDAMTHAAEMLTAAGDNEWTIVRTPVLWLLMSYIAVIRPVPTEHGDDFNKWQDDIDAGATSP